MKIYIKWTIRNRKDRWTVSYRGEMKGKGKGPRNERRLARALSLLISNGERDDLLWRTAGSGGRATARKKRGATTETQAGDIGSTHQDSHWLVNDWFIEAKHYSDLQILHGFLHNKGRLYKFWQKAVEEANSYQKRPLLLAKQNRMPEFFIVKRGQRVNGAYAVPLMTLPHWGADVYLFKQITTLKPSTYKRERVMIDE